MNQQKMERQSPGVHPRQKADTPIQLGLNTPQPCQCPHDLLLAHPQPPGELPEIMDTRKCGILLIKVGKIYRQNILSNG